MVSIPSKKFVLGNIIIIVFRYYVSTKGKSGIREYFYFWVFVDLLVLVICEYDLVILTVCLSLILQRVSQLLWVPLRFLYTWSKRQYYYAFLFKICVKAIPSDYEMELHYTQKRRLLKGTSCQLKFYFWIIKKVALLCFNIIAVSHALLRRNTQRSSKITSEDSDVAYFSLKIPVYKIFIIVDLIARRVHKQTIKK